MLREPVFDLPAGPSRGFCAWADAAVQDPAGSSAQELLRDGIRERAALLRAQPDELLHAVYNGPKPPEAGIEDLLMYDIDASGGSFRAGARGGLRFEWAAGPVPKYRKSEWRCWFGYRLAVPDERFLHWRYGRTLATIDELELGAEGGEARVDRIAPALRGAQTPEHEFVIDLRLSVPPTVQPLSRALVTAVFDGVTGALPSDPGAASPARLRPQLVAGQLVFERNGAAPWSLTGRVCEAVRDDWAQDYYAESG